MEQRLVDAFIETLVIDARDAGQKPVQHRRSGENLQFAGAPHRVSAVAGIERPQGGGDVGLHRALLQPQAVGDEFLVSV